MLTQFCFGLARVQNMKLSIFSGLLAFASAAAVVSASDSNLPPKEEAQAIKDLFNRFSIPLCGKNCYKKAVKATSCDVTDLSCLCSPANSDTVKKAGLPCVMMDCASSEWPQALIGVRAACRSVGFDV